MAFEEILNFELFVHFVAENVRIQLTDFELDVPLYLAVICLFLCYSPVG